jgi:hypothetical protein
MNWLEQVLQAREVVRGARERLEAYAREGDEGRQRRQDALAREVGAEVRRDSGVQRERLERARDGMSWRREEAVRKGEDQEKALARERGPELGR